MVESKWMEGRKMTRDIHLTREDNSYLEKLYNYGLRETVFFLFHTKNSISYNNNNDYYTINPDNYYQSRVLNRR